MKFGVQKFIAVVVCLCIVGVYSACTSYANVRATGDWTVDADHGATPNKQLWQADEPLGLMNQGGDCVYSVTVRNLVANKQYQWKVTIGNTWTTNYGCPGANGPNCYFTAAASGVETLQFNPSTNVLTAVVASPTPAPTPAPTPTPTPAPTSAPTPAPTSAPTTRAPTSAPTSAPTAAPTSAPTSAPVYNKFVFAHFMLGNTYTYSQAKFQTDITAAKAAGIDGFALNVGSESWQWTSATTIFAAANVVGGFKLFISFDMTVSWDVTTIVNKIAAYASNPAQYKYNNKVFVSTFAGEYVNLGAASANAGWQNVKNTLSSQGINIYFVPNWSGVDGNTVFTNNPVMDGIFSWIAWPGPTESASDLTTFDNLYISKSSSVGKTYMAPVSPWFYAHIQNWSKNYLYKSEFLFIDRWEVLKTSQATFIEIITWNDWGESSYIGPLETDQGNIPDGSEPYVNGFPHDAWRSILSYYIQYYKSGVQPAIQSDVVIIWYRPHAAAASSPDPYPRPTVQNRDTSPSTYSPSSVLADNVFVFALLKSAATITLTSGGVVSNFLGVAGTNKFSTAFRVGTQSVSVTRNSATVCSHTGSAQVVSSPSTYNYNVYVGQCA